MVCFKAVKIKQIVYLTSVRSVSSVVFNVAYDTAPESGIFVPDGVMIILVGVPLTPAFMPSVYCALTLFLNCPLGVQFSNFLLGVHCDLFSQLPACFRAAQVFFCKNFYHDTIEGWESGCMLR